METCHTNFVLSSLVRNLQKKVICGLKRIYMGTCT